MKNRKKFIIALGLLPSVLFSRPEVESLRFDIGQFPVRIIDIAIAIFFLLVLFEKHIGQSKFAYPKRHIPIEIILLTVFVILGSINGLVQRNPTYLLIREIRNFAWIIGGYYCLFSLIKTRNDYFMFVRIMTAIGFVNVLTLFRIFLFSGLVKSADQIIQEGPFVLSAVSFPILFNYCFLILLSLWISKIRLYSKNRNFFYLIIFGISGALTIIRSEWIGIIAGIIVILIMYSTTRASLRLISSIILIMIGVFVLSWAFMEKTGVSLIEAFSPKLSLSSTGTISGRIEEVKSVIKGNKGFYDWTIGRGLAAPNWDFLYTHPEWIPADVDIYVGTHSTYGLFLLDGGLLGLLSILLLAIAPIYRAIRAAKAVRKNRGDQALCIAAAATNAAMAFSAIPGGGFVATIAPPIVSYVLAFSTLTPLIVSEKVGSISAANITISR